MYKIEMANLSKNTEFEMIKGRGCMMSYVLWEVRAYKVMPK